jgi:hypothetical protein
MFFTIIESDENEEEIDENDVEFIKEIVTMITITKKIMIIVKAAMLARTITIIMLEPIFYKPI